MQGGLELNNILAEQFRYSKSEKDVRGGQGMASPFSIIAPPELGSSHPSLSQLTLPPHSSQTESTRHFSSDLPANEPRK